MLSLGMTGVTTEPSLYVFIFLLCIRTHSINQVALRKTRWDMGRWGWWGGQGTEEQLLAELIAEELEYGILKTQSPACFSRCFFLFFLLHVTEEFIIDYTQKSLVGYMVVCLVPGSSKIRYILSLFVIHNPLTSFPPLCPLHSLRE